MSAVFRGNFHFVSSRHLASCFGFACPIPCKIRRSRTPGSLGALQGLAQATRETFPALVLTPLSRASLQIFTFMTTKNTLEIQNTPPKPLQNILFQAAAGISAVPGEAGRAAALTVDYPFPLNFSLHFLSPPSWEEQLRLWSSAALGAGLESAGNG